RDGTIIDHPLHNVKNKKIESLIATSEKKRILNALSGLKKDESLLISKSKDQFGHSIELFFRDNNEQIQGLLFFPSELTKFIATHERHTLIAISLLLHLFFCCMLILFALFFIAFPHGWWIIIILISCAMVIEIG